MMPSLPSFPKWPDVAWYFQNGMYCLSEEDADRILDFGENRLVRFEHELEQYRRKAEIIFQSLTDKALSENSE